MGKRLEREVVKRQPSPGRCFSYAALILVALAATDAATDTYVYTLRCEDGVVLFKGTQAAVETVRKRIAGFDGDPWVAPVVSFLEADRPLGTLEISPFYLQPAGPVAAGTAKVASYRLGDLFRIGWLRGLRAGLAEWVVQLESQGWRVFYEGTRLTPDGFQSPALIELQSSGLGEVFPPLKIGGEPVYEDRRGGFHIAVLDPETGAVLKVDRFDTRKNPKASRRMIAFLKALPEGSLIAVSVFGEVAKDLEAGVVEALQDFGAQQSILGKRFFSYLLVGVKGKGPAQVEALGYGTLLAVVFPRGRGREAFDAYREQGGRAAIYLYRDDEGVFRAEVLEP